MLSANAVACQQERENLVPSAPVQVVRRTLATEPKAPQVLLARARLKGSVDLLRDGRHVALTSAPREHPSVDRTWITFGPNGIERAQPLPKQVEMAFSRTTEAVCFLGRTPIIASVKEGQPVWRATAEAVTQVEPIRGRIQTVLALRGGLEAWLVTDTSHDDLFIVGPDEQRRHLAIPTDPIGPKVPGLSALGATVCAIPRIHRIAATKDAVVALVVECHGDAPMRLVRWNIATSERTVMVLPKLEALDESELVANSGDVAVVGQTVGSRELVFFRESQRWQAVPTGIRAKAFRDAFMDDDGRVWALRMGGETRGDFDLQVLQNGDRQIVLQTTTGRRLAPTSIAYDEQLGVVATGVDTETFEKWLAAEKWSTFFRDSLP